MPKKADPNVVAQTVETVRRVAQEIGFTGNRGELVRLAKVLDERGLETPSGGQWHFSKGGPIGLTRFIKKYMPEGLPVAEQGVPQEHTPAPDGDRETPAHESTQANLAYESIQENMAAPVLPTHTAVLQEQRDHRSTRGLTDDRVSPETTSDYGEGHTPDNAPDREPRAHTVLQLDSKAAADLAEMLNWWRQRRGDLQIPQIARDERPAFKGPRRTTKTVRLSEPLAKAAEKYAQRHRAQTGGTFSGLCEWLIWQCLGRPERFVTQDPTD